MNTSNKPDAVLLVSSHCPHCHTLQSLLEEKLGEDKIANLKIINIEEDPSQTEKYTVRSVPWLKLGLFEFDGVLTPVELDHWIVKNGETGADIIFLEYLLENGKLKKVIDWLEEGKSSLKDFCSIIVKKDIKINVRIGVGAVMEHFEGTPTIVATIPDLEQMLEHENPVVRTDVCHYLMLSHHADAKPSIKKLLNDTDSEVRETARESLEEL